MIRIFTFGHMLQRNFTLPKVTVEHQGRTDKDMSPIHFSPGSNSRFSRKVRGAEVLNLPSILKFVAEYLV